MPRNAGIWVENMFIHPTSCICLNSYGMDLLFQAETKIPFHFSPFTQMVFCSVRNKESFCIRNSYHLWFLWRRKMESLCQRVKKRHESTDTIGSLHRHQSVTAWGKWNLFVLVAWWMACFQIRWPSNSVYQTSPFLCVNRNSAALRWVRTNQSFWQ